MSTLRSDRLKKRDTLLRQASTAYDEYATMMKMHQAMRKDERRRAGTLRKAAPPSESRVNLRSRPVASSQAVESAPPTRIDLVKALRPRLHEAQSIDLVKAVHRAGGEPLVKFAARPLAKAAPAAAHVPEPEVEYVEETNELALYALEARDQNTKREEHLASIREVLSGPGRSIGAGTWK